MYGMFKGDPGTGKSIAACSWAALGKTRVIDFDGKIGAAITYYKETCKRPDIMANLEYYQYKTYNEGMIDLADWTDDPSFNRPGNTIILDTLTTGVDSLLVDIGDIKGKEKSKDKLKFVGNVQVSDIEDFNAETSALTRLVQGTKFKLQCNFILIAHVVQSRQNLLDGSVKTSRQLITAGKKIAAKLPVYFDEIYHFDSAQDFGDTNTIRPTKYFCYTKHSGDDFARTSLKITEKFDFTNKAFYDLWIRELDYIKLGG
jgi:hypothetical protein